MDRALDRLEEYVLDEDKIVTIASFANDAHISLVDSKDILKKYVDSHKESGKIHATFILCGTTKNNQQTSIIVVKDSDLAEKKQLFEADVCESVFSVQKSDKIDLNLIALADPINEKILESPLSGLIASKNCTKRAIKKKIIPPAPAPQSKPSIFGKQNSQKSGDSIKSETESNLKQKNSQGGISSMFSKMSQNKSEETKTKQEKANPNLKSAGISGFFTKMSSSSESVGKTNMKPEEKISPKMEKISPTGKTELKSDVNMLPNDRKISQKEEKQDKKELFDSDSNDEIEQMVASMDVDVVKKEKTKMSKTKKPEKNLVKKRRAKNDADKSHSTKRRKRIVVAEESDSDDVFAGSEKEDNSLSEPDAEPIQDVVKKPLAVKNKRKKAVDKTYQDDEGFIVTRKEYIYETASEDENEEPKKAITAEVKPKTNVLSKKSNSNHSDIEIVEGTPQKGKGGKKGANKTASNQPTLMSFFAKK